MVRVTPNLLDKAILYINPKKGMQRLASRAKYQNLAYTGASKKKRSMLSWGAENGSSDTDDLPELDDLRIRSRDHYRNTPVVTGAVNTKKYNIVGSGLRLQAEIDAVVLGMSDEVASEWERFTEFEFRLWSESKLADMERTKDFYEQQGVALISEMVSGDVFALLPYVESEFNPYSLSVMLIESDRVCTPDDEQQNKSIKEGIEHDEFGAPNFYHIAKNHPGEDGFANEWEKIPAYGESGRTNVIHLFDQKRPGQKRGVPMLAPVMETLKQLQDYTNAELMAALISGMFTVFVKTEDGQLPEGFPSEGDTVSKEDPATYELGSGAIVGLADGEDITTANPGRPNDQFDPFTSSILKQVASGLDMPYELLMKHFSASYSASRGALLEAWKAFKARRTSFAKNYCQPIYEEWLAEAILLGRVDAPGFFDDPSIRKAYCGAQWNGPTQGQLDPVKETNAAKDRVNEGFSTRTKEAAEMNGTDFEQNAKRAKGENKLMREAEFIVNDKKEATKKEIDPEEDKSETKKEEDKKDEE